MDTTLRCQNCGGANPADATYCIECGRPFAAAATGPTQRLDPPRPSVYTRPAAPSPPFAPAPPYTRGSRRPDLTTPLLIIGAALLFLLVPRFGPAALAIVGVLGLLAHAVLTRPDRVVPLLVFAGLMLVLFTGGKLFWPILIGFFVLRAVCGGRRCW